jgi:DNA polymerase
MSVSNRQQQYLEAMGVQVWTRRQPAAQARAAGSARPASASPVADDAEATAAGMDWQALRTSVSSCTACGLHASRTHSVFGAGDRDADWLFVGEAPGFEEDRQGEPFVGRAGQLLNAMLRALGLSREAVYIANVLKCRPPENRDPAGDEVRQCEPYLHRQVELIRPAIIVALGRFAAQSLLKSSETIGRLRGRAHSYADIPLVVTYHPAYLLRNPLDKRKTWDDLQLAQSIINKS